MSGGRKTIGKRKSRNRTYLRQRRRLRYIGESRQPLAELGIGVLPANPEEAVEWSDTDDDDFLDRANHHSMSDPTFLDLRDGFEHGLAKINVLHCIHCNEKKLVQYKPRNPVCKRCLSAPQRQIFAADDMDPGPIPAVLERLTPIEKLLIAQVVPMMSIHRLPRGGQFGFKGHVLNLPQDVYTFVTDLPRRLDQLNTLVLKQGNDRPDLPAPIYTVNRLRVETALQWLKANNRYYAEITINDRNLNALPVNGVVDLPMNTMNPRDNEEPPEVTVNAEDDNRALPQTFIQCQRPGLAEQDAILAAIDNDQVVQWPVRGAIPINEFNTVGYIARAFPCLFPYGRGDLREPRQREVSAKQYFNHLLRYYDGRFQAEPRFLFLAHNSLQRWQSLQIGRVYVRNNPGDGARTVQDIRELAQNDQHSLTNRVLHFGSGIRGTPSFWFTQRCNLMSMISQIGKSTIFFTFSCADLQWPDLTRFLDANRSRAHSVSHSPLTVDNYMYIRFDIFFKTFLTPYLNLTDYWYRFEWQHRGTLHVHGVAWLDNPPDTKVCSAETIKQFWDRYVSSWNPAITPQDDATNFFWPVPIDQHPCSKALADINNLDSDIKDLVNICQKHTRCTPAYCLRIMPDGQQKCRFGFPQPLQRYTAVNFQVDDQQQRVGLQVQPARNDPLLNKFNPHCLATWRANMDISLTLNMTDVANYIAKYASKHEKPSTNYLQVFQELMDGLRSESPMHRAANALLMSTVGNMDICAQQAAHIVSGLPLYHCSRTFVMCVVDGEFIQDELHAREPAPFRKYMTRPAELENISYMEVLQKYTMNTKDGHIQFKRITTKDRIVRVLPKLSCDPNGDNYSKFCRQQLLLYKPFRAWTDATEGFMSEVEAYRNLLLESPHLNLDTGAATAANHLQQAVDEAAEAIRQEEPLEPEPVAADRWMALLNPDQPERALPISQEDFDWAAASRPMQYILPLARTFIQGEKANAGDTITDISGHGAPDHNLLNNEQQQVFERITCHMNDDNPNKMPLRIMILGSAGTGKSFLIQCLKALLNKCCALLAPTGVAALNIKGSTIHSYLHFAKVGDALPALRGESLQRLQSKLSHVNYIIIDELSMIGSKLLNAIDSRLRQGYPGNSDEFFGGCSLILFGDLGQLAPVGDPRLFKSTPHNVSAARGHAAYRSFDTVFRLTQCVRQANDHHFRDLLLRLRDGQTTEQDYHSFSSRFMGIVPDAEQETFSDTVHLFPTRESVREHNLARLLELAQPIAQIESAHNNNTAKAASSNTAGGLERYCSLSIGARVMLRANLWVERGLVNGSVGYVHHIVFANEDQPPALPAAVLVRFPQYTGPSILENEDCVVPIVPVHRTWSADNTILSRTGLPLSLAYALTVHKSQGLTMPKAVVDIGQHDMSAGISFVAVSRVRKLRDLLLAPFDSERLMSLSKNKYIQERLHEEQRLFELN